MLDDEFTQDYPIGDNTERNLQRTSIIGGRLASLLAALLFVWLGAAHAHGRVLAAVDPIALSGAVGEICGIEGSGHSGFQGHCPLCVLEAIDDLPGPVAETAPQTAPGFVEFPNFETIAAWAPTRGTLGARGPPQPFT